MMSYSFNPALLSPRPARIETTTEAPQTSANTNTNNNTGSVQSRRFTLIDDDMISLDYLIGVLRVNECYTFVQYEPTDKHKHSAGIKNAPVHQINMFMTALRDNSVLFDAAMWISTDSTQRTLWLKIPMSDLTELSLEPLWMIAGQVQLYAEQSYIAISIHDKSLDNISLDPSTSLLTKSTHMEFKEPEPLPPAPVEEEQEDDDEYDDEEEEIPVVSLDRNKRKLSQMRLKQASSQPLPQKLKITESKRVAVQPKKRPHTTYNSKRKFIAKNNNSAHRYTTDNISNTSDTNLGSPALPSNTTEDDGDMYMEPIEHVFAPAVTVETRENRGSPVTHVEQPSVSEARVVEEKDEAVSQVRSSTTMTVDPRPRLRDVCPRDPEPEAPAGNLCQGDRSPQEEKKKKSGCLVM